MCNRVLEARDGVVTRVAARSPEAPRPLARPPAQCPLARPPAQRPLARPPAQPPLARGESEPDKEVNTSWLMGIIYRVSYAD